MTAPAPDPTTNLAVELATLRGDINTGIADIKGSLGVLVDRTNRTDADVRQLRADMESEVQKIRDDEVKPLRARVEALEGRRFPLPVVSALAAVGGVIAAAVGLVVTLLIN
ncbi:hypothetical protein [Streptomyces sp. NPDC045251]|uniref:hypothetical protein n=1 Tax=unclassified Streptomyces TaxID=2593676 RepID=UPI0033FB0E98